MFGVWGLGLLILKVLKVNCTPAHALPHTDARARRKEVRASTTAGTGFRGGAEPVPDTRRVGRIKGLLEQLEVAGVLGCWACGFGVWDWGFGLMVLGFGFCVTGFVLMVFVFGFSRKSRST